MNPSTLIRQAPSPVPTQPAVPPSHSVETGGLGEMKTAAKEQLGQTGTDLKHGAQEALHAAKEAGTDFVIDQKKRLTARIDEFTDAMRAASESLKVDASNPLAGPAEKASRQLERAADYLRHHSPGDFLDDLGTLARRRPEVFFGGLFILGLATARFLKASAPAPNRIRSAGTPANDQNIDQRPLVVISPEIRETRNEAFPS